MPDDPVIVTGGVTDSVQISFDDNVFSSDSLSGGSFAASGKRITSVVVKDDNTNQTQTINAPSNGKCTVTIYYD